MLNRETSSETRRAEGDHEARLADSREKRDLAMSKIREGFFHAKVSLLEKRIARIVSSGKSSRGLGLRAQWA